MALVAAKASRLKPEIRLAQSISLFEADLTTDQRLELHAYRSQMLNRPPDLKDVMRLTADIDRRASEKGLRRCIGPRLTNFLQAVQQFAGLGDIIIGGSQNIIACGVWSLVRLSLLLVVNFSSYLERISTILMAVGRSAPRFQRMALLYSRSPQLQAHLSEYYILVVGLCHRLLKFTQKSVMSQLAAGIVSSELDTYQSQLERWANAIKEEVALLMAEKLEAEAAENSQFRALTAMFSTSTSNLQKLQTHQLVLTSLSTYDYETAWKQTRKIGNTTLLNKCAEYIDWKRQTTSTTLLYTGKLGSGKSVLLANMVDDLNLQDGDFPVAYFFCRHDVPQSLKARTVAGSIARQLLQGIPNLTFVANPHDEMLSKINLRKIFEPQSFHEALPIMNVGRIFELLQRHLSPTPTRYIILDGIDECEKAETNELMKHLRALQLDNNILICLSARLESSSALIDSLTNDTSVILASIPDKNPDIEDFIEAELEHCIESKKLTLGDPSLILEIQDALSAGSKGMFLWTALQIKSLCEMQTDEAIRQALQNLPKDLSETFSRILKKSSNVKYQRSIFELVIAAQRPLTPEEIREALSVVPGETAWDPAKRLNNAFVALSSCGSLLTIDEEDSSVRLVHHSARQFLLDGYHGGETKFTIEDAKKATAEKLVTYLNYDIFDSQLSTSSVLHVMSGNATSKIVQSALGPSSTASNLALQFLRSRKQLDFDMSKVLINAGKSRATGKFPFRSYCRSYWAQHVICLRDVDSVFYSLLVKLFRGNEVEFDDTNNFGRTPLWMAIQKNAQGVALAFLESEKVHVDLGNAFGKEMLKRALRNGHEDVIKRLVKTAESLESIDTGNQNLLIWAASQGSETLVRLLLETGEVDVESKDDHSCTALSKAAERGHVAAMKVLLEIGEASVNSKDVYCYTPLSRAARRGHVEAVRLLIDTEDTDVNSKDKDGSTALWWAAENGKEEVVRLLLESGKAEVDDANSYGQTALSIAENRGHHTIVKLLESYGGRRSLSARFHE